MTWHDIHTCVYMTTIVRADLGVFRGHHESPCVFRARFRFCPKTLNAHTGRYDYENVVTGDVLSFQNSGAWCVGSDCSSAVGGASPIGVMMTSHEASVTVDVGGRVDPWGFAPVEILWQFSWKKWGNWCFTRVTRGFFWELPPRWSTTLAVDAENESRFSFTVS